MKIIKSYKLFESHWEKEEYIEEVVKQLSKYDITPVNLKELVAQYENEIEKRCSVSEHPLVLVGEIVKDLELKRNSNSMSVYFGKDRRGETTL